MKEHPAIVEFQYRAMIKETYGEEVLQIYNMLPTTDAPAARLKKALENYSFKSIGNKNTE